MSMPGSAGRETDRGRLQEAAQLCLEEESGTLSLSTEEAEEDPLLHMELLGKVEIQCLIGEGNRGRVYRAWHRELNLPVAVKFLHEHFVDSPEKVKRFKSEAKIASSITHPSIVKVFDYGFASTGQPFIIMEYVPDGTLANVIATVPVDLATFFKFFALVADGLSHAHNQGILHRDLKPENILVQKDSTGALIPKISDWGIAKVVFSNEVNPQFTATGDVMGSPAYMSPEQCLGRPIGAPSDLYSMACVMYEWLTRKPAFSGRNAFDCMRMHLEHQPEAISRIRSDVPPALEKLISKCLEKDPRERPQTANQLNDLLTKIGRGKHQEALRAMSTLGGKSISRPWMVVTVSALLVLALAIICFNGFLSGRLRQSPAQTAPAADLADIDVSDIQQEKAGAKASVNPELESHTGSLKDIVYDFRLAERFYQATGKPAAAANAQKEIDAAVRLYKSAEFPKSDTARVHLVSFDQGEPLKKFDPRGTANVRVTCTNEPVILALAAGAEVQWKVSLDPGVLVEKIFLIGEKQHVNPIPGVPVIELGNKDREYGYLDQIGGARLEETTKTLRAQAKSEISTWQSALSAGKGTWFVGPESLDWRAQRVINLLKTAHRQILQDMGGTFEYTLKPDAMHLSIPRVIDAVNRQCQRKFGSIVFPADRLKLLPGASTMPGSFSPSQSSAPAGFQSNGTCPIVELQKLHQFFHAEFNQICEIDPVSGQRDDLGAPAGSDLAYGENALCPDPGGKGFYFKDVRSLYHMTLPQGGWTKVGDVLPPPPAYRQILKGLTYSARDNALYSLFDQLPSANGQCRYLGKISMNGKLSLIKLSRRIGSELSGKSPQVQIFDCGRYLMAIFSTDTPGTDKVQAYCYGIDPGNGQVKLVGSITTDTGSWKQ